MTEEKQVKRDPIKDQGKSKEVLEAENKINLKEHTPNELEQDIIREDAGSEEEAKAEIEAEAQRRARKAAMMNAIKEVNPEVPSSLLLNRPTTGFSHAKAEIHMHFAYSLLVGRSANAKTNQKMIVGLFGAAKNCNNLVRAYYAGCLFASQQLIKLEAEINNALEAFKTKEEEIITAFDKANLLQTNAFVSNKPATIDLSFTTPYGYQLANLLVRFDQILRRIYPYKSMGLITPKEFQEIQRPFSKQMRRIFTQNNNYFFVGPEHIKNKSDVYYQAINMFGELLPDTVSGKLRPQLIEVPKIFD